MGFSLPSLLTLSPSLTSTGISSRLQEGQLRLPAAFPCLCVAMVIPVAALDPHCCSRILCLGRAALPAACLEHLPSYHHGTKV